MTAQKMKEFIDLHIKEQVSIEIGNAIINVSYQVPISLRTARHNNILVTGGLGVVSEHVQAAHIEHLVQLSSGLLVVWARNIRGQLGSSGLIGEVRLLCSSEMRGGGDSTSSRETCEGTQPEAGTKSRHDR